MRMAPQEMRTYFTTFSTAGRRRLFQVERNADLMVSILQKYREEGRYQLHAFIVMPDHLHVLLTPAFEIPLEKAIQYIKGGFSFQLKSKLPVWERGHFDKRVPDRVAYDACVAYIDNNPVKAGIVQSAPEYPFGSGTGITQLDPAPEWFSA